MRDKRIYKATDGSEWTRSRWLKVRCDWFEKPNPRHGLYDYMTDGGGYSVHSNEFDPTDGVLVEYFRWHGMRFALSRFYALGSVWVKGSPIEIIERDGSLSRVGAVDMDGDMFNPIYVEFDKWGEEVRVYERV